MPSQRLTSKAVTISASFTHLIGAGQERRREIKAERLRSLQVDDQLEFSRPLDGQVGRLRASQYAIDIQRRAPVQIYRIDTVRHQAAIGDEVTVWIDRGQASFGRRSRDESTIAHGRAVRQHNDTSIRLSRESIQRLLDAELVSNGGVDYLNSQGSANCVHRGSVELSRFRGGRRIKDEADPRGPGSDFLQYLEPLAAHREFVVGQAGEIASRSPEVRNQFATDGIIEQREHNWDRSGCVLQGYRHGRARRDNHVRCQGDEFCRGASYAIEIRPWPADVDPNVPPLDPA